MNHWIDAMNYSFDPLSQFYKDMLDKLERKPMFIKCISPDVFATMENGSIVKPLVTLRDLGWGVSHIIKDDGCYVLINSVSSLIGPNAPILYFMKSTHWYPEAVKALGDYLKPKPIYFADSHFCDAAEYAKAMDAKPGAIQMAPETDADVARSALKEIAKNTALLPETRVKAASTLLAYRDE